MTRWYENEFAHTEMLDSVIELQKSLNFLALCCKVPSRLNVSIFVMLFIHVMLLAKESTPIYCKKCILSPKQFFLVYTVKHRLWILHFRQNSQKQQFIIVAVLPVASNLHCHCLSDCGKRLSLINVPFSWIDNCYQRY